MPNRYFPKNQALHVVSRSVANTNIFENEDDCCRFIFQVQAANTGTPAPNIKRRNIKRAAEYLLKGKDPDNLIIKRHEPFVHLLDFSLIKTHYHFFLVQNIENGLVYFMHKLNLAFAKYFNMKYERMGAVFSGTYRAEEVSNNFNKIRHHFLSYV